MSFEELNVENLHVRDRACIYILLPTFERHDRIPNQTNLQKIIKKILR